MIKNVNKNSLTRKEQSTTVAYKMMSDKIKNLERSLKKTQDEAQKMQKENHELDKNVVLLESKLEGKVVIAILRFLSSGGMGFAANYITSDNIYLGLSIGIPSIVIFVASIVLNKK